MEDTRTVPGEGAGSEEKRVEILVSTDPGTWVRQVGSDISLGELILPAGQVILIQHRHPKVYAKILISLPSLGRKGPGRTSTPCPP